MHMYGTFCLMLFCREYVYLTRMFSSKYLSCIYCILYYCPHLLDKTSSKLHCVLTMKFRFKMIDPIFTTCYSKYMTRFGKPSIDHVVYYPSLLLIQMEIKLLILIVVLILRVQSCQNTEKLS